MRRYLLILLGVVLPGVASAHDAPSKAELIDELRGISRTLRSARLKVDHKLAVDERSTLQALNSALVAYFSEDFERAAIELTQLVARPGVKARKAYPEALEYLGESLASMGLPESATVHLRESLGPEGQLPSQFARRLTRFLRVAKARATPAEARGYFQRLRAMQTDEDRQRHWARQAHYEFGRALHRAGELDEADDIFRAVDDPDDPRYLHALYYLGVSQVARGNLVAATEAFDVAIEAYEGARPALPGDPVEYLDVDEDGPAREWVKLEVDEEAIVGDEDERRLRRVGAAIHLAAARLAAARDDDVRAFELYRAVPPGDPDFAAALSEATYVLFRRGKFAWCARLVDQLLAGRGDDLSAAQLLLWKGQLLARTDDADLARAQFRTLADQLASREGRFAAEVGAAQRVFPTPVLAWSPPEVARGASALEANYVEQEEALIEANETLAVLEAIRADRGALPAVVVGRALSDKLQNRMVDLGARMDKAQAAAHMLADPEHEDEHPEALASLTDMAKLRDSYSRLEVRLQRYGDRLSTFDQRFRKRLDVILRAETPNLRRYATELRVTRDRLAALSGELETVAQENVEAYTAEALFGEVDVAFWHKQAMTQQISDFLVEHQRSNEPLNDVRREAEALGIRLSEAPEEAEPAFDDGEDGEDLEAAAEPSADAEVPAGDEAPAAE